MDNFSQILLRISTSASASSTSSRFRDATPFKVQVNFDIPLFEVQINAYSIDNWLNVLEGYFYVHNFSNKEKITFALLRQSPMSKIVGVLTGIKTHQMSLECLRQIPLGTLSQMSSTNNITLWETIMTSTQNGPFCIKRGTRWCQSTPTTVIPCVQIWV